MINLFLSQNENFKIVKVQFPTSTKIYSYKTTLDVKVGDSVIVDAPSSGMTILEVIEVVTGAETDLQYNFQLKWIVQKVDTTYYEEVIEMEKVLNKEINKIRANKAREEMLEVAKDALGEEAVKDLKKLVRL